MNQRRLQLLAGIILLIDLGDLRSSSSPHFSLCTPSEEAHCATHNKLNKFPERRTTMSHLGNHPGELFACSGLCAGYTRGIKHERNETVFFRLLVEQK